MVRVACFPLEAGDTADLHLLGGGGHFVQVDQPRQVANLIVGEPAGDYMWPGPLTETVPAAATCTRSNGRCRLTGTRTERCRPNPKYFMQ